jgi:hypothetical protein
MIFVFLFMLDRTPLRPEALGTCVQLDQSLTARQTEHDLVLKEPDDAAAQASSGWIGAICSDVFSEFFVPADGTGATKFKRSGNFPALWAALGQASSACLSYARGDAAHQAQ